MKLIISVVLALLVQVLGQDLKYERAELNGYIFSIPDTQLPWAQAVTECESRGQKLAAVDSAEKDDILVQLFVEGKNTSVSLKGNSWISATEAREGVWYWQSLDKPLYHTRWFMDGQPDDKDNLNCVYLAASALLYWRDANCSASMYYICEGDPDLTGSTTTLSSFPPGSSSSNPESTTASSPPMKTIGSYLTFLTALIVLFNI